MEPVSGSVRLTHIAHVVHGYVGKFPLSLSNTTTAKGLGMVREVFVLRCHVQASCCPMTWFQDPLVPCSQVYGYCMYKNGEEAKLAYPTEGFEGDVSGRSFHNGRFVQRLRQAAASVPSLTVRQAMVKRLLNGEAGHLTSTRTFMQPSACCTISVAARLVGQAFLQRLSQAAGSRPT